MSSVLLPELNATNRAFWTGGGDGKLLIARCRTCRTWIHPPVSYCSGCGGREIAPEAVSGRGQVYCYTLNYMPWMTDESAWQRVIALVELPEQPALRILTNIVECDPGDVANGLEVEVVFHHFDDVYLPLFRPGGAS